MFRSRSWFFSSSSSSTSLWKPKNPHSTEYLKYLHTVLTKNTTITEQNKSLLVEALRSIAEILIWGDQNDPSVFDFFLEKNMLSFFLKIMKQNKCGSYVCVQLLQTLNILFENIKNPTSIYYLLSNNHVNSIIEHKFDFSDEEVMAYYISFLKTLSFKLNSQTIHFFYNENTHDFPLYTEAIKFFNNPESMVRIAVRTLTLNVFRVDDKSMLQFIRDKTAAPYFSNLIYFIANHVLEIDRAINRWNEVAEDPKKQRHRLDDLIAEHLDHLHYVNDILLLGIVDLNEVLVEWILENLVQPLVVMVLEQKEEKISTILALYLLTQLFSIVTNEQLLEKLLLIIPENLSQLIDTVETDYLTFFVLTLFHSILNAQKKIKQQNLQKKLLTIIQSSTSSSTVRIATLSLTTDLFLRLFPSIPDPELAAIESSREENISQLLHYFNTEEMFLELFEDEYSKKLVSMENLLADSCLLVMPVSSPLNGGVPLELRGACGETERIRRAIRIYFLLRNLSLRLRGEEEKYLPLSQMHRNCVQLEQCLDLTNSDLLACMVMLPQQQKLRRFLVVDFFQFILVEPSQKRMGWGVVKFVGFLQDLEVVGDPNDTRSLHITVKSSPITTNKLKPLLSGKFIFDDHIRCMAARQRLTKGRLKARERKLNLISRALLSDNLQKYSPPQNLKTVQQQQGRYTAMRALPGGVVVDVTGAGGVVSGGASGGVVKDDGVEKQETIGNNKIFNV